MELAEKTAIHKKYNIKARKVFIVCYLSKTGLSYPVKSHIKNTKPIIGRNEQILFFGVAETLPLAMQAFRSPTNTIIHKVIIIAVSIVFWFVLKTILLFLLAMGDVKMFIKDSTGVVLFRLLPLKHFKFFGV